MNKKCAPVLNQKKLVEENYHLIGALLFLF